MDADGRVHGVVRPSDLSGYAGAADWIARPPHVVGAGQAWTRRLFERFGPLPAGTVAEDLILVFRAIVAGGATTLAEPLVRYRRGGLSGRRRALTPQQVRERLAANARHSLVELPQLLADAERAGVAAEVEAELARASCAASATSWRRSTARTALAGRLAPLPARGRGAARAAPARADVRRLPAARRALVRAQAHEAAPPGARRTAAMTDTLHIVEPTLVDFAGHCHSLVRALAGAAAPGCEVVIWAARDADAAAWDGPGTLRPHFRRRLRRLESYLLYRRLLRAPGRILVATAGSTELALAARAAARGAVPAHKMHFFVHWLGAKGGKAGLLASVARRQPRFEILAPTATVAEFFAGCGFRTTQVPYPVARRGAAPPAHPAPFRHLVVAGAARMDKGFGHVVELVCEMQRRGLRIPIAVQASREHGREPEPALAAALERLRAAGYEALSLVEDALDPPRYRALFEGGVALQPYRAEDFRDRVSGVTLDALGAGCPAVVTAGTWMAGVVQRFDAGVATGDLSGAGLLAAVETVLADHPRYAAGALAASRELAARHSARRLVDAVLQRMPAVG